MLVNISLLITYELCDINQKSSQSVIQVISMHLFVFTIIWCFIQVRTRYQISKFPFRKRKLGWIIMTNSLHIPTINLEVFAEILTFVRLYYRLVNQSNFFFLERALYQTYFTAKTSAFLNYFELHKPNLNKINTPKWSA